jgi:hypothetical protein
MKLKDDELNLRINKFLTKKMDRYPEIDNLTIVMTGKVWR